MTGITASPLSSAGIRESLASDPKAFKISPLKRQGAYHGRVLSGFATDAIARHAARILAECDGYDVTSFLGQDRKIQVAVIARKPE